MRWWITFWLVVAFLALVGAGMSPPARAAVASCYGNADDGFLGQHTADGTLVTSSTVGIANKHLSFRTWLMIKVGTHAPVRARVMDRGPYSGHRTIDVTEGFARAAGFSDCRHWGVQRVTTWRAR